MYLKVLQDIVIRIMDMLDENDQVICPIFFEYKCPLCQATGPKAHTLNFCPVALKRQEKIAKWKQENFRRYIPPNNEKTQF